MIKTTVDSKNLFYLVSLTIQAMVACLLSGPHGQHLLPMFMNKTWPTRDPSDHRFTTVLSLDHFG